MKNARGGYLYITGWKGAPKSAIRARNGERALEKRLGRSSGKGGRARKGDGCPVYKRADEWVRVGGIAGVDEASEARFIARRSPRGKSHPAGGR